MTTKTVNFLTSSTQNPLTNNGGAGYWLNANSSNGTVKNTNGSGVNGATQTTPYNEIYLWDSANYAFAAGAQTSQITLGAINSFDLMGCTVLGSGTTAFNGYALYVLQSTDWAVAKFVSGALTQLSSSTPNTAFAQGDVWELVYTPGASNQLTVYQNGVIVTAGTTTDATYRSGQPGIYYSDQSSNLSFIAAWQGTDTFSSTASQNFYLSTDDYS